MQSAKITGRQLDRKLFQFKRLRLSPPPRSGWLRAIRRALGMSQADVARRIGVSQPSVDGFERAEASGAITLASLRRVAGTMDCDLVYALVPRRGLEASVEARARELAMEMVRRTDHTMRLESQGVPEAETRRQVAELARILAARPPRGFWSSRR
jgi:predicted DNA-binding mobile mystery protein A